MARIFGITLCTLVLFCLQSIQGVPVQPSVNDHDFDLYDDAAPIHCDNDNVSQSNLTISDGGTNNAVTCLNMANNKIQKVGSHAFEGNPNLEHLDLSNNPFPLAEMLQNLSMPKLQTLNLDCNETICYRQRPTAPTILRLRCDLPELRELYIRRRRVFKITSTQFNIFPKLTRLYLSNNFIHRNPFIWLPSSLEYLNVRNNELTILYFRNLPKLMYLSVARNRITRINKTSLVHLNWLMNIDLSFNDIESIEEGSFDNLRSLRNLNLEGNKLTEIPELHSNLTSLFLSENKLRNIQSGVFDGVPKLKALYLNNNEIANIDQNAFAKLKNLEVLVLRSNSIVKLPPSWIMPLTILQHLDLGNNEFRSMTSLSLQITPSNITLHLQNNRYMSTDSKLFDSLDNSVKVILDSYRRPYGRKYF